MRKFFAALILAAFAVAMLGLFRPAGAADFESEALQTVRAITVPEGMTGAASICSAVVIAPGYAMTARHCTKIGMHVDGLPATYAIVAAGVDADIGLVHAPGLACPCAALGARPAVGESLTIVGFPSGGERRSVGPAKVRLIGSLSDVLPDMTYPGVFIISDTAVLMYGDSGGGAFANRESRWELIGINSVGLPARAPTHPWDTDIPEIGSGFVPVDLAPAGR